MRFTAAITFNGAFYERLPAQTSEWQNIILPEDQEARRVGRVQRNLCITHVEKCGPLYSRIRHNMLRVAFRPNKSFDPEFTAAARITQYESRSVEKPVSGASAYGISVFLGDFGLGQTVIRGN